MFSCAYFALSSDDVSSTFSLEKSEICDAVSVCRHHLYFSLIFSSYNVFCCHSKIKQIWKWSNISFFCLLYACYFTSKYLYRMCANKQNFFSCFICSITAFLVPYLGFYSMCFCWHCFNIAPSEVFGSKLTIRRCQYQFYTFFFVYCVWLSELFHF